MTWQNRDYRKRKVLQNRSRLNKRSFKAPPSLSSTRRWRRSSGTSSPWWRGSTGCRAGSRRWRSRGRSKSPARPKLRPKGRTKIQACTEGTAANRKRSWLEGHRFETRRQQGLLSMESLLKSTLPLDICVQNIN